MVALIWLFIGLGGLVAVAGSIWFLAVAFRVHVLWGLACLFIPFAALVFLIKYWNEAKIPFLVNLVGSVLCVVAVLGFAAYSASTAVNDFAEFDFDQGSSFPESGGGASDLDSAADSGDWWDEEAPLEEAGPEPEPGREADSFGEPSSALEQLPVGDQSAASEELDIDTIDLGEAPVYPTPTPSNYGRRMWGDEVPLSELSKLIGRKIEIHTTDNTSFRAELDSVGETSIRIKQRMGAGYVAYDLPLDRIVAVRIKPH